MVAAVAELLMFKLGQALLFRGRPEVFDAELAGSFGSIPHVDLLKSIARRIASPAKGTLHCLVNC
jgi:hypothetical protein